MCVPFFTGDPVMNTRQWRCPSQLLHLSALLPPAPKCTNSSYQQHCIPKQTLKLYRGLSAYISMQLCLQLSLLGSKSFLSSFRASIFPYSVPQVVISMKWHINQYLHTLGPIYNSCFFFSMADLPHPSIWHWFQTLFQLRAWCQISKSTAAADKVSETESLSVYQHREILSPHTPNSRMRNRRSSQVNMHV